MSPLSKVFELNRKGLNVPRGLVVLGVQAVPLIVLDVIGKDPAGPAASPEQPQQQPG
jgi:hypothetical protein